MFLIYCFLLERKKLSRQPLIQRISFSFPFIYRRYSLAEYPVVLQASIRYGGNCRPLSVRRLTPTARNEFDFA